MTTDNKPGFVPETPPDPSYPCGPLSNIRECASDFDPQTRVVATTHELKIAPEHFEEQSAGTQRLGQAFYDHFKLHKLMDQTQLKNLFSKDGEEAKSCIREVFKIH